MIDAFVDCSDARVSPRVPSWFSEGLGSGSLTDLGRGTYYVPGAGEGTASAEASGWTASRAAGAIAACNEALAQAALAGRPLLVVLRPLSMTSAAVDVLRQCLDLDPMFGFAVPRLGSRDGQGIAAVPADGVLDSPWVPRRVLVELPEHEILVEQTCACAIIGSQLLSELGQLDEGFEGLDAALVHYMAGARRRGFRVVLANRAVVEEGAALSAAADKGLAPIASEDFERLSRLVPDRERIWRQSRGGSAERFDRILGTALAGIERRDRFSLLLDLRNLSDMHNGTSHAALGAARALHRLCGDSRVGVLATQDGATFHQLRDLFPRWQIHTSPVDDVFTVALRLSQPWRIQDVIDLHHRALFNAFLFLDTIAWDIQYLGPQHLEGTWGFLADHADAFFFISDFTRQRFHSRFEAARETPSVVCHLSMDASDYVMDVGVDRAGGGGYLLVVGNELNHKDVAQTVDLLSTAFPFQRLEVLGSSASSTPLVARHRSGSLSDLEVHRLYAGARVVVYPSFYEGFGFPIVTALGYGLTVVARHSDLVDEVAGYCRPKGRLLTYRHRDELVETIGRLVHHEAVSELPVGRRFVPDRPKTWDQVARDILQLLEQLVAQPSGSRWRRREHVVQQLLASRS